MSDADTRRGRKPYAGAGVVCSVWEPGDERQGDYSYEQRIRMDNRFRARLLRAFETGAESRAAAAATNGANASRLP